MTTDSPPTAEFRPQAPEYWIRRYLPKEDGFVLAPIDGDGDEVRASIDPQSPSKGRVRELLLDSLFGHRSAIMPLRLLIREDRRGGPAAGARELLVTDAFAPRWAKDSDARKILGPDGRIHSRWSDGLDEAVAHHGRLWLARRATEYFLGMEGGTYGQVRLRATGGLPSALASRLPEDFLTALQGAEGGRQCRYNPRLPLNLQTQGPASDDQQVNYGIQRALVEEFAREMTTGESALESAQASLLSSEVLLAAHPGLSAVSLKRLTGEAARGIASQVLAGLMELNGAGPASQDFDELSAPLADGSFGRRPTLHDEILREMEPHPIAASADFAEKTAAYLELGASRLERYDAEARSKVFAEQMKTAGGTKPKQPNSAPMAGAANAPDVAAGSTGGLGAVATVGNPVAAAADHAHRLITQSETIPWF